MKDKKTFVLAIMMGVCAAVVMPGCVGSTAGNLRSGQQPSEVESKDVRRMWKVQLPSELQGKIYQTQIVGGEGIEVLATTSKYVLSVSGEAKSALLLKRQGEMGESAILPSPTITTPLQSTAIGILVHKHHAIDHFRLVNLQGEVLLEIKDRRNFHYRLAPDGSTIVGIDAGDEHTGLTAETVIYHVYNRQGEAIGEIKSNKPQSIDSSYSPDGKIFLVNSQLDGLSAYGSTTLQNLWKIPRRIKFFAISNQPTGRVVVSHFDHRNLAELYEAGKLRWTVNLEKLGIKGNIRNLDISPNGEFVAMTTDTSVLILDPEHSTPVAQFTPGETFTINSLSVNDNGQVAVGFQQAGAKDGHAGEGGVVVLDDTGQRIFSKLTRHEVSNAWIPTVNFDPSGHFLLIRTLESMEMFSVDKK